MEQRRSRRYAQALDVELVLGRNRIEAKTLDVSRHGLFVATETTIAERQLLQLVIGLPSGPLPATAVVSHSKTGRGGDAGIGLQLFALSSWSKQKWDEFVYGLDAAGAAPSTLRDEPDFATFLIKLKNVNRLLEFYDRNVRAGVVYLTTPVLREQGAKIALNIIHPKSEEEYVLKGNVGSVCMDTPKGMEILLHRLDDSELARFREFVTTGVCPSVPEPVVAPTKAVGVALPPAFPEPAPETLSIDIDVDESAFEDSTQFVWRDVTEDDLVIDFDAAGLGEVRDGGSQDLSIPVGGMTGDLSGDLRRSGTGNLAPRERLASVRCESCGADYGSYRIGPARGALGLLASHQPYWWANEEKVVSILRLDPTEQRRATRAGLGEAELSEAVSLRLAFKIADMSLPPRCPDGSTARVTPLIRALRESTTPLEDSERVPLESITCASCQSRGLFVERWD